MSVLETIRKWRPWKGQPKLEVLPFEELQNRYAEDPEGVYREFIRRLHRLVFYAAEDYLRRQGNPDQHEIEEMTMRVFEDFGPEFGSGEPIRLLVRFSSAIRRVLDEEAFQQIAEIYYRLLPTYHITDNTERRFLAAAYQAALAGDGHLQIDEMLAERFDTTAEQTASILVSARRHWDDIIRKDFERAELQDATEGYLP